MHFVCHTTLNKVYLILSYIILYNLIWVSPYPEWPLYTSWKYHDRLVHDRYEPISSLQWRHNDGVSNHQPHDCLLKRLFRRRSKKTSKLRVTGLCEGNSPVTGEFPARRASNAENVSIWWSHHDSDKIPWKWLSHCRTYVQRSYTKELEFAAQRWQYRQCLIIS